MALFALRPFLLLCQTQVFLTYPRIVHLLESASTAATLAFMSALNFTVSNDYFFSPWESFVLVVSDLTLFYLEHRTVAFLSSAFIHPIRHLFMLAFLYVLSVTTISGVGYFLAIMYWGGQVSVVPETACLAAQEWAARNGVSVSQNEVVPVPLLARKWGFEEPVHGFSSSSHLPLHIFVFCGQGKENRNVLYL